jgi:cation diffusion facilitator CzcD-associated flavoprotein CzcO
MNQLLMNEQDPSFDWKDKSIAVIGSGATSIQVVPQMQSEAKKIEVFVRSPTYILPTVGFGIESSSFNEICECCSHDLTSWAG